MDKELLESYIKSGLSLRKIVKKTGKSLTTVRYWTDKHNLKSQHEPLGKEKEYGEYRFCPSCKQEVLTEHFHSKKGKKNASPYCKICTTAQTVKRQRQNKIKMVEYKGGKCERCGYNKSFAALDFHHEDPSEKDFTIAHARHRSFNEEMKKELDKCILVCANCHREIHEEINTKKYNNSTYFKN